MLKEIFEYLDCKSMDEIVEACNDIYEYRYLTGVLKADSIIRGMSSATDFPIRDLCDAIEEYAAEKFNRVVKMLMIEKPFRYIDTRS